MILLNDCGTELQATKVKEALEGLGVKDLRIKKHDLWLLDGRYEHATVTVIAKAAKAISETVNAILEDGL